MSYGRLHSAGELRGFVRAGPDRAVGIYGGVRDAGRLVCFSPEHGLVDLGRTRVSRDNPELSGCDTEWANIHYISCIAYSEEDGWLCAASGELYGCIVRYRGVKFPQ